MERERDIERDKKVRTCSDLQKFERDFVNETQLDGDGDLVDGSWPGDHGNLVKDGFVNGVASAVSEEEGDGLEEEKRRREEK